MNALATPGLRLSRTDAHQYAREHGRRLPSLRLLDKGIRRLKEGKIAYAKEFLVLHKAYDFYNPSARLSFFWKRGKDLVDPQTKTRLPWEFVRDLDFFSSHWRGLLVSPEKLDIHKRTGGTVLLPESITLLDGIIQLFSTWQLGEMDEKTGMPLEISMEAMLRRLEPGGSDGDKIRWFLRARSPGIRPLICGHFQYFTPPMWHGVLANESPGAVFNVVFEDELLMGVEAAKKREE